MPSILAPWLVSSAVNATPVSNTSSHPRVCCSFPHRGNRSADCTIQRIAPYYKDRGIQYGWTRLPGNLSDLWKVDISSEVEDHLLYSLRQEKFNIDTKSMIALFKKKLCVRIVAGTLSTRTSNSLGRQRYELHLRRVKGNVR